jgi:hypothetical protein
MNTFELRCRDPLKSLHFVHVVAEDEGDAMITFRETKTFQDWVVEALRKVNESCVVQEYDFINIK